MNIPLLVIFSMLLLAACQAAEEVKTVEEPKPDADQPRVKRMWADDEPPPPPPPEPRPTSVEERQWRDEADLFSACDDGDLERVRSILTSGMRSRYQKPVVDVNVKFDYYKQGRYVSRHFEDGTTPLIVASKKGHLWVVEFLTRRKRLPGGVRVDDKDRSGFTAVMYAAQNGHYSVVRLLARPPVYADVNVRNNDGQTAVIIAAKQNQIRIVEFLAMETNANVNEKDKDGMTALMIAARDGFESVVRFLARPPYADVNLRNNDGKTALMFASLQNQLRIVEFLVQETSVNVNMQDRDGLTALMIASRDGHSHVVQFFVEPPKRGIDLNARDNRGQTAYQLAGTGYGVRSEDRYNTIEVLRRCRQCAK